MSNRDRFTAEQLEFEAKLQSLGDTIRTLASSRKGESLALLSLLRVLEGLHQEIRESLFQDSLPDNRQALYSLLKDIEASGGWPYIHRMKLRSLLSNFQDLSNSQDLSEGEMVTMFASLTPTPPVDETID